MDAAAQACLQSAAVCEGAVPPLLDRTKVTEALPNWCWDDARKAIARRLIFRDFGDAFDFMTRVAVLAEHQNHHPEWSNVYNQVDVWLTTHEAGGVTARDLMLARGIDTLLGAVSGLSGRRSMPIEAASNLETMRGSADAVKQGPTDKMQLTPTEFSLTADKFLS